MTTYLTKLVLDPSSRAVWRDLANCHELHRTVMAAFPDLRDASSMAGTNVGSADHPRGSGARCAMNVLYRVEFSPRRYAPVLLVQSMTEPTWSRLPNSYVLGGTNENGAAIKVKMIDEFLDSIETGQVLRFRLLADPTRKIKTTTRAQVDAGTPKSNGCRVPLRDDETRLEWLSRKGKDHGFNLLSVRISKEVPDVIVRSHGISEGKKILQAVLTKKGKKDDGATTSLTFEGVLFDGYLRVTDKALLVNAIRSGIGPGKAYGFGLLSVAPCQHPDA